jgi:ADP-heptose:LPS heptosyltransferase
VRGRGEYRNYSRRARAIAWSLDRAAAPVLPLLRRLAPRAATGESILVVRLDHLGDMLMTTPAIAALRRLRPAARLDVLAAPWGRAALEGNPHVDRILEAPAPWYDPRRGEPPPPAEVLGAALRARRGGYGWAFDMRGDPRVVLFYLLPAARRRFGFSALGLEGLLTDARPYDRRRSPLDLALDLAALAGATPGGRRPVFAVDDAARRDAAARLAALGAERGTAYAIMAPGSNRPAAQWGAERYAALADRLADSGIRVVLTGREADRAVTGEVIRRAVRPLADTTGLFGLRELAAALEGAAVCVTNDSGASHLAAAVGCPTVAIFGPTDPLLTFPYEDGSTFVSLAASIDHPRPCFDGGCDSDHGFPRVTPDEALRVALRVRRPTGAPLAGPRPASIL